MRRLAVLATVLAMPACVSNLDPLPGGAAGSAAAPSGPDAGAATAVTDFDREMMQIAMNYKMFPKIDSRPYTSSIGTYQINVYATGDVRDYRAIHPEISGSNVTVAVGTVIVREELAPSGQVSELTMIAKGPAGYDPTLGDWWFGDTDPSGAPIMNGGAPQVGRVQGCHGCHVPRATDDYLFGVPKVDETGH